MHTYQAITKFLRAKSKLPGPSLNRELNRIATGTSDACSQQTRSIAEQTRASTVILETTSLVESVARRHKHQTSDISLYSVNNVFILQQDLTYVTT